MPGSGALRDFLANAEITGTPFLPILAFCVVGMGLAVLFRLGLFRGYWPGMYRNQDLPFYQRNSPFAAIPYGMGTLSMLIALYVIIPNDPGGRWDTLAVAMIAAMPIFGALGLAISYRPPWWVKPRWLREEEELERLGPRSAYLEEAEGRARYVPRWQMLLGWAVIVIAPLGVAFLDWPRGALLGAVMGVPVMRALRVREKRRPPFILHRRR